MDLNFSGSQVREWVLSAFPGNEVGGPVFGDLEQELSIFGHSNCPPLCTLVG